MLDKFPPIELAATTSFSSAATEHCIVFLPQGSVHNVKNFCVQTTCTEGIKSELRIIEPNWQKIEQLSALRI